MNSGRDRRVGEIKKKDDNIVLLHEVRDTQVDGGYSLVMTVCEN